MSTVPIFAPDGTLGDIPYEQLHAAVAAGAKPGVTVKAPDGSIGVIPADRMHEALSVPGASIIPFEEQETQHAGFWDAVKKDFMPAIEGLAMGALGPPGMAYQGVKKGLEEYKALTTTGQTLEQQQAARQKAAGYGPGYRYVATPLAEGAGVNVPAMEEAAAQGDIGGVAGHTVIPAAMAAAPLAGEGALRAGSAAIDAIPAPVRAAVRAGAGKLPAAAVKRIPYVGKVAYDVYTAGAKAAAEARAAEAPAPIAPEAAPAPVAPETPAGAPVYRDATLDRRNVPEYAGEAPETPAAPRQVAGSAKAAAADTDFYQQAKTQLGPDASVSEILLKAQELKTGIPNVAIERPLAQAPKTPLPAGEATSGNYGAASTVKTSSIDLPAKFKLVEADALAPSHNAQTFAINERYPSGVQERAYHSSKEAQARVIQQAQNYDPRYTVNTNPDAVNGPPVVTPDGTVLGGNSRAMSTQRLYQAGQGDVYKNYLKENAEQFGLSPEAIDQMKAPVLVREVPRPPDIDAARALGRELNKNMTGALGTSEKAVSAGRAITPQSLNSIAGLLDNLGPEANIRELLGKHGPDVLNMLIKDGAITERERPQFVDTATGGLSEEGKQFAERALLGTVVDSPTLMDQAPKAVLNKLGASLADITSVAPRADDFNIIGAVRESIADHADIAARGSNVATYLDQTGMFGGERNPVVDAVTRKLAKGSKDVRAAFRSFASDANVASEGQGTLSGFDKPTPEKSFNEAFGTNLSAEQYEKALAQLRPKQVEAIVDREVPEHGSNLLTKARIDHALRQGDVEGAQTALDDAARVKAELAKTELPANQAPSMGAGTVNDADIRATIDRDIARHFPAEGGRRIVPSVQNIRENDAMVRAAERGPGPRRADLLEDKALGQEMNWGLEREGWRVESEARREFIARNSTGATKGELNRQFDEAIGKKTKPAAEPPAGTTVPQGDMTSLLEQSLEQAKAAKTAAPEGEQSRPFAGPESSKTYGKRNKLVSEEDADRARISLQNKLFRSHAGLDPTMLADAVQIGTYHIEAGLREFGAWSQKMVNDIGEEIRPHLARIWGELGSGAAPAFYSKAARVISEKVPNAASGDSILATLRNAGVKENEIGWTGLDDFLNGKARVTKPELEQFMRENRIQLEETNIGAGMKRLDFLETNEPAGKTWTSNEGPYDYRIEHRGPGYYYAEQTHTRNGSALAEHFVGLTDAKRWFNELRAEQGLGSGTHFEQYTLPGNKSNYTERLLTLPPKQQSAAWFKVYNEREAAARELGQFVRGEHPDNPSGTTMDFGTPEYEAAKTQYDALQKRFEDLDRQLKELDNRGPTFTGGHFKEASNVLAHTRFDDRVDTAGKKVLFLEEVQSDWHQKGKQVGYQEAGRFTPEELELKALNAKTWQGNYEWTPEEKARAKELQAKVGVSLQEKASRARDQVPDAPFKSDWHELVIKRMLREAAEKGYDKLAWTTGEQQADRYGIAKQVKQLAYDPDGEHLVALDHNDNVAIDKSGIKRAQLADYVGKEVAERLLAEPLEEGMAPDQAGNKPLIGSAHWLAGEDLRIGGGWAKALYDRAIPNFLNKYAKKWGAKVGETEIPEVRRANVFKVDSPHAQFGVEFEGPNGEMRKEYFKHLDTAKAFARDRNQGGTKVHSIDITPAMKKSLLEEGQPISENRPMESPAELQAAV